MPRPASPPTAQPITPLGLMLKVMRQREHDGDTEGALALARLAAPYVHPRMTPNTSAAALADTPDAELDSFRPQD